MELMWKQLLNTMRQIIKQGRRLCELARRQREAIINEDIQGIGELVIQQEKEMESFQMLEKERAALAQALCREVQLPEEDTTLSKILPLVPAKWSNDYRNDAEQLRRQIREMKKENEINQKLLNRSHQFTTWLLKYLVTPEGALPGYDCQGENAQQTYHHIVNQNM